MEEVALTSALEELFCVAPREEAAPRSAALRALDREIAARREGDDDGRQRLLRLVHGHRRRSEAEGRYLLARAFAARERNLLSEEERRQVEAAKRKHDGDRNRLAKAHATQLKEFVATWEAFMTKYDQQCSDCVAELEEAHREQISKLQQSVADQMDAHPVKWSRELLQHRKRQALMADQRRYREAQATKTAGDALEEEERADRNSGLHASLRRRERALRERQRAERDVLAQRVGSERRKLERRRDEEVARLAQRNRIILAGVEAKQASECSNLASKVKENMKDLLDDSYTC